MTSYSEFKANGSTNLVVTVLVVADEDAAGRLRAVLSGRYQSSSESLVVRVDASSAPIAIEEARNEHGGAPLGYVAMDEEEALVALSHGADEVLVWPPRDDHTIQGFHDRTKLRAHLRKGQEKSQSALAQAEKLTALGTLVAGVAHEVNNPLTALQLSVEALNVSLGPISEITEQVGVWASRNWGATPEQIQDLEELSKSAGSQREVGELLNEMMTASTAISDVVRDLRVFARADDHREEARVADANDIADQALRLVWRDLAAVGNIERDYDPDLPRLVVPASRLVQVLVNVLINAAHAMAEVQRPTHRVRVSTRTDEEFVAISITDTGPGIEAEGIEHIFDPFFTTKRTGLGTGLGLSISRSLMLEMGGDLLVESVHGTGATFMALVPIPDQETVRDAFFQTAPASTPPPAMRRSSILIVDDDERILKAYARVLGRSCNIITASDGREAMDLLNSGSKADAMITELNLPEVDGPQFFEWLTQHHPALARRTVFVAAESTRERYASFVRELEGNPVLTKPLNASALMEALERTVGS